MARALAVTALHGALFLAAILFIALVLSGCATPPDQKMDWGSLARELHDIQQKGQTP